MSIVGTIGRRTIDQFHIAIQVFAVLGSVLGQTFRPRNWPRTTRSVFARQILFTGVEALPFVSLVALLAGVSIVAQAQVWLGRLGQSGMLGPFLVSVILREAAPLLVNMILIGRSGTAVAVEMANMRVTGEIHVLESQGLDPLLYLAMPRALALALCSLCLTIWFTLVALVSGYACGILFGAGATDPQLFAEAVLKALQPADLGNLPAKTLLPGLFTACICILEGLRARYSITEVPQAATRAVVRSIAALFILSALVSVLTYV